MPPAADGPDLEVLNLSVLEELEALGAETGDPGFLDNTILSFFTSMDSTLKDFRAAVVAGRPEQAVFAIHTMKGAAGPLGAQRLYALCQQVEIALRGGDIDAAPRSLPKVESEVAAALEALRRFSANRL